MPERKLPSWIAGFIEFTKGMRSPDILRRWAAIATVAGAMERKVWLRSQGENIYPNLYVFLVGPPGSGKTRALMACWHLWNTLDSHHIAEISLTKPALIDRLSASTRTIHAGDIAPFNALLIAAPELGALLPAYDADFMNTLTHLYDGHLYTERRRTAKTEFEPIARPNINLVACTTPGFLVSSLPAGAWNEGFLSRVCVAYSGDTEVKPFDLREKNTYSPEELRSALIHDLRKIGDRVGKIGWTERAMDLAEAFNMKDFDLPQLPKPTHPRLMHYNTRRPVHFLKLCMICAIDRGANVIDTPDVNTAVDFMLELESSAPDVFTAMASGGDAQVISDCVHWVLTENVRLLDAGVPMSRVHEYLATRAPATHVVRIFDVMERSKMISTFATTGGMVVKARSVKP
jgi:hypothetical protein